jgi:hypothetical protein
MHELIAWCGFVGAWLLVAGPVYQAAIELGEEEFEREELRHATEGVEPPPRVSPWWWLAPPVGYLLNRRRRRQWREAAVHALTRAQLEQFVSFVNKATGWMYIALGASLIAAKETWDLRETYEWHSSVFWILVALMLVLAAFNTAVRTKHTHDLLDD